MLLQEINPGNIIHVFPINDLKQHWVENGDMDSCPCLPTVKFEGVGAIIVHNAWDNREIIEQANEILDELNKEKSHGKDEETDKE